MHKKALTFTVSLAVSAAILFFFLRQTPLAEVQRAFASLPLRYIGLFILLSLVGSLLRCWRYAILLEFRISFGDLFLITLVRNFSVDLLPARSAALVLYTYLTNKRGIRWEDGAASFVITIFYDALSLMVLLSILLLFLREHASRNSIYIALALIFLASLAVIRYASVPLALLARSRLLQRWPAVKTALHNIIAYLAGHRRFGETLRIFLLSFILRSVKYLSLFLIFAGSTGCGFTIKTFALLTFGIAGAEFSAMLPIQGLAGLGTWEAAFAFTVSQLHLPVPNPFLTALVVHLVTQAWEYLIGLLAFIYLAMSAKRQPAKKD